MLGNIFVEAVQEALAEILVVGRWVVVKVVRESLLVENQAAAAEIRVAGSSVVQKAFDVAGTLVEGSLAD